ncbi:MAG TPA: permease-like cell division protein FtsX [Candidatus Saccharimonadales bacterium]
MNRRWVTISRVLQYGFDNFRRNTWLTTAATIVMSVTLLIVTTSFILRMIFADTISQIRSRIDVSIFLKDGINEEQLKRLKRAVGEVPIVTDIMYISKDDAKKIFEQQNQGDFEQLQALQEIQENPFPASLRVKTSDPNRLQEVSAVAEKKEFKELQSAPISNSGERRQAIDKIANWSRTFEVASLVASIVFVVISVLIIFNTIRMAIYNRKDEIQIMRLIGANPSFIRGPFIVEAGLYGVIAGTISLILVYAVVLTQSGTLLKKAAQDIVVAPTITLFQHWPIIIVPTLLLVGVLIGVFSSYLAIRRYLKDH